MYTKEEENLIILDALSHLTYKNKILLLDEGTSSEPNFEKYAEVLIKTLTVGVYNKLKKDFCDQTFRQSVLDELETKGITAITRFSPLYPEELALLPLPPLVLYCKGNVQLLKGDKFAIVGSRTALATARKQSENFARTLAENFVVVTGIADGIDTSVIEGALESGNVICVLAHGFNYVYPAINANLLKRVIEKGLVITEFTAHVQARNFTFPIRNRIIAGLSRGVLVASAGKKSGALITAEYAFEYSKDVFAFPYSSGIESGEGCNALIKNGANLCDDVGDILSAFGIEKKSVQAQKLSDDEKKIVDALRRKGPLHVEEVAKILNVQPFQITVTISMLEIKGLIAKIGGNRISAV